MKWTLIYVIVFSFFSLQVYSQSDCACCSDYHKQFDFWVGEWEVYDTTGKKVGNNTIVKLEDNCILSEHWKGAGGFTGRSYNYFNNIDSTWNQVWIDNAGSNLVLKGERTGNQMILKSELLPGNKVKWYSNRIIWTNNDDGTVSQRWDILDENNEVLRTVFNGIYRKLE